MIEIQYKEGYKHGKADARIIDYKELRYMSINNLNYKHDDFLLGFFQGFIDQKKLIDEDNETQTQMS